MKNLIDERETCLRRLPTPYSLALRLRDAGVDDSEICGYLAIEPEALRTLLALAEAKFQAVRDARAAASTSKSPSAGRSTAP